ncbi:MAG: hypothetical protein ACI4VT_01875 [Bacilli bacterium]|nr:hypothetical protein [bacterium]MDY3757513.1 hypothetical protein [Bacilli bacterium]
MEITIPSIITFVTLIMGMISKKFSIMNSKHIPFQNVLIGIVSGVLVFLTDLEPNILNAIITCLIASLGAGGLYDTIKAKSK